MRLLERRFRVKVPLEKAWAHLVLDGEGFGVGVFGRVFAAIYAVNLDRAIPNLVAEMEGS